MRQIPSIRFTVRYNDDVDTLDFDEFDKLIFSPGPDLPSHSGSLLSIIAHYKYTHPMLGICLGHQAIAESFGASLYQLKHPRHGEQVHFSLIKNHAILNCVNNTSVGLYHSWAVAKDNFPKDLEITGLGKDQIILSIKHKTLPIHGVQFHPESYISTDGYGVIDNFIKE